MDVFIGNLSRSTTLHDIRSACRKWDFDAQFESKSGTYQIGKSYHYYVARFGPGLEKEAERMIKLLKNVSIEGRPIKSREYVHRSYVNERRALDWRTRPWDGVERRCQERRVVDVALAV